MAFNSRPNGRFTPENGHLMDYAVQWMGTENQVFPYAHYWPVFGVLAVLCYVGRLVLSGNAIDTGTVAPRGVET